MPSARSRHLLTGLALSLAGCPSSETTAPAPSEAPASQPASLPADHDTSTTAVNLEALFALPGDLPDVVARVEDRPITRAMLEHELRQMQVQLSATGLPDSTERADVLAGALDRSVDHALRALLAEELDVEAEEAAVRAWLADVDRRMESDPAFAAFLLRAGKDAEQRAVDARRQAELAAIFDAVKADVAGELEAKARDYYARHPLDYVERAGVEVWRIFIKAPRGMVQRDRDLARGKAEDLRAKAADAPEAFENLARAHSEGGKAPQGGYMGFVPRGALDPALEEKLWAARPGAVLPLWESAEGFSVYKVGARREEREVPFEEVRDAIVERIFGPLVRRETEERVRKLRDAKKLEVFAPALREAKTKAEAKRSRVPAAD